jgi:hypothetical protein
MGNGRLDIVPNRGLFASFAAATKFVKAECRERAKQGKARGQREEQRQNRIAENHACQSQTNQRINHAEVERVGWNCLEILPAKPQRIAQIGKADLADDRK